MPIETVEIGPTPAEEACAQTGKTEDCTRFSKIECRAYIQALTRVFGNPPDGGRYETKKFQHESGSYHEVVYRYDQAAVAAAAHADYADKVESGLAHWAEAAMWAPVLYDRQSQAAHVIDTIELLDRDANPQAKNASGVARPRELAET